MNFKVGDRVVYNADGDKGTITRFERNKVWVAWDNANEAEAWVGEHEISKFSSYGSHATAVNPNHYVFPGGVEVRQISAHLTSFGGQAVQYVARATRLDGQNKGEAVEDLKKAIKFLTWEIERIEEA